MTRFADILDAFDHAHVLARPLAPVWIARDGAEYVVGTIGRPPRAMVLLATVGTVGGAELREARREARQRRAGPKAANGVHEKLDTRAANG